jgi:hypothetical protein
LDAMATEFFSSRVHVIVGVPWKDAVISHLEPRSASCVTEDVWTCALCAVAYTPEDLATLLADKLPCWRWAAFASVLVQRRAEVQSRLRDSQLGYGRPTGEHADSGVEVGRFVVGPDGGAAHAGRSGGELHADPGVRRRVRRPG